MAEASSITLKPFLKDNVHVFQNPTGIMTTATGILSGYAKILKASLNKVRKNM
jgi:hypothetical protein